MQRNNLTANSRTWAAGGKAVAVTTAAIVGTALLLAPNAYAQKKGQPEGNRETVAKPMSE